MGLKLDMNNATAEKATDADKACPLNISVLEGHLSAGTLLLPLRLILGWTYFSAFWRRLVLENKLDPDTAGYIGEKFNHFLPNALWIKPQIEYFVSNPDLLWWKLLAFTIIEGIVGAFLMVGLMTRLMGLATSFLALGILLGAGWLGTTCLDEWQIGILGIGSGLAFAWAGGGVYSLDYAFAPRLARLIKTLPLWIPKCRDLFGWSCSTRFNRSHGPQIILLSTIVFGLTLYTNQVFHGGVWGKLQNLSVNPKVELSDAKIQSGELSVQLYRTEGADVYGSFAIEVRVVDDMDRILVSWDGKALSQLPATSISNRFVAKIKNGPHSLILPLGAKGTIKLSDPKLMDLSKVQQTNVELKIVLVDISGETWSAPIAIQPTE